MNARLIDVQRIDQTRPSSTVAVNSSHTEIGEGTLYSLVIAEAQIELPDGDEQDERHERRQPHRERPPPPRLDDDRRCVERVEALQRLGDVPFQLVVDVRSGRDVADVPDVTRHGW